MPLPIVPFVAALMAGGSLVPHAAGGFIVTSSAAGYVAGTYVSSATIASLLAGASAALGVGALTFSGAASAIIGTAGIFGTTAGASGLTAALMSAGILPSTPIWVPIAAVGSGIGIVYLSYLVWKLRRKLKTACNGQEMRFTEKEAKIVEAILRRAAKQELDNGVQG